MTVLSSREATARRLNQSSVERNYDPDVDIDWSAPVDPAGAYHSDELVSLYGTELWESMTDEQRRTLGRLEYGWTAAQGIVAEIGLMTQLLRVGVMDPLTEHGQYALTEMADECRHSTMFSRSLATMRQEGDPAIPTIPPAVASLLRLITVSIPDSPTGWASLLYVEDTLDKLQRETMKDERLQPLIRMVNRIHVVEEARHMTYAREELRRSLDESGRLGFAINRFMIGLMVWASSQLVVPPFAYAAVGLDPARAVEEARHNPVRLAAVRRHADRYLRTMQEVGVVTGRFTLGFWRKAGLL